MPTPKRKPSPKGRPTAKKVARLKKSAATAGKSAGRSAKSASSTKKAARPKTAKTVRVKKSAARRKKSSGLGRVRVSSDARLDLVFQKDYQAREIFDFLKVQSIRELEQFAPDEILERLTGPMVQTVLRIRKTLALANRSLARDTEFAKAFLKEVLASAAK